MDDQTCGKKESVRAQSFSQSIFGDIDTLISSLWESGRQLFIKPSRGYLAQLLAVRKQNIRMHICDFKITFFCSQN